LRKIPMRFRGTNFWTSSERFALSFVGQHNGPKCTQTVRNAPKHDFRVQWGGSGAFVAKNSNATSWHKFLHYFGPFCTEFRKATKQSKMHLNGTNTTKHEFRVQRGGSGALVAKNSDATLWHKLLHLFGSFCTEFRKQSNGLKCTQMVRNATKLEFSVQWGRSGAFVAKNSDANSWHEHFGTKAPEPPHWTLNSCFGVFRTIGCVR